MLAELREPDAPPHVAAIYADIRQVTGVALVNLVFRHLATHEGMLEWIWPALRPLYLSAELQGATNAVLGRIERPGPSPLDSLLTGRARADCKAVIDSYNKGNPQNLIALTAFVKALDGAAGKEPPAVALAPQEAVTGAGGVPVMPLPKRDELAPATMAVIEGLASLHTLEPGVVPSLYIHLSHWPQALAAANVYLQSVVTAPDWRNRVDEVIKSVAAESETLAAGIRFEGTPPDEALLRQVAATVSTFVNASIPEMIVVGRLLAL